MLKVQKYKDIDSLIRREIRFKARFKYSATRLKVKNEKLVIYFREVDDKERFMIYLTLNYPNEVTEQICLELS